MEETMIKCNFCKKETSTHRASKTAACIGCGKVMCWDCKSKSNARYVSIIKEDDVYLCPKCNKKSPADAKALLKSAVELETLVLKNAKLRMALNEKESKQSELVKSRYNELKMKRAIDNSKKIGFKTNRNDIFNFLKAINHLADEIVLEFDGDSVNTVAIDPSRIAMVILKLKGQSKIKEPIKVEVNIKKMMEVLEPNSDESIEVLKSDTRHVYLRHGDMIHEIELSYGAVSPKVPNMKHSQDTTISLKKYREFIKTAQRTCDWYQMIGFKGQNRLMSYNDANKVQRKIPGGSTKHLTIALYSADDTGNIIGSIKDIQSNKDIKDDNINIRWSEDHPFSITLERGNISGEYMLAPRVEANQEEKWKVTKAEVMEIINKNP